MSSIDLNSIKKKGRPVPVRGSDRSNWFGYLGDLMNKDIHLSIDNAMGDVFKENFYSGLALLLAEGIPIKTAFTIILEETEKEKVVTRLTIIRDKVVNGEKLAEAIKGDENFTGYEYYSIAIGEESGQLIEVLNELSVYFKRKSKLKRQLTSAMIYPAIVLSVALGAIVFMLNFVVPMFSDVFRRFQGDLPAITKAIISFSIVFKQYFGVLFILILIVLGVIYSQRQKVWFKQYSSAAILRIPVLGELIRKIYVARFCQSLSLLLRSRVSIIQSLDMVKNMINYYPIEVTIESMKAGIMRGDSLHSSLSMFPVYHKKMVNMVRVAEDVNKLDEMLGKISVQLSEDTEHQIELFNKLLEPVLIVILGVIVGTILVAMYLPLFQLGSQIGA